MKFEVSDANDPFGKQVEISRKANPGGGTGRREGQKEEKKDRFFPRKADSSRSRRKTGLWEKALQAQNTKSSPGAPPLASGLLLNVIHKSFHKL